MTGVDILIMTALQEEFDAAQAVGALHTTATGRPAEWQERDRDGSAPYQYIEIRGTGGALLTVALARPTRIGGRSIGPTATTLVEHLAPSVLAMSGVCAGNPKMVDLGDVVVAETVYEYDEGRRTTNSFQADHRQIPLEEPWVRVAQDFSPVGLPSYGKATQDEATLWFLERLLAGEEPRNHPARRRYFPAGTWTAWLAELEGKGLITRHGVGWALSITGRGLIERRLYDDVDGPEQLPFAVHVGPMASGSFVATDSTIWDQLEEQGVRTAASLEMEAATIATIARQRQLPHWLVVKGVMDHADPRKDDRYRKFAARASAEVLVALLTRLVVPPSSEQAGAPHHDTSTTSPAGRLNWHRLLSPPEVLWRSELDNRLPNHSGYEAVELHLAPVGDEGRLQVSDLNRLKVELPDHGRRHGIFSATDALGASSDGTKVVVLSRERGTVGGLAVTRSGQRSVWLGLPRDGLGAVLDESHLTEQLVSLLEAISSLPLPAAELVVPAIGIEPATMVTIGTVTQMPRNSAGIGLGMPRYVRPLAEEAVTSAAVTSHGQDVATELVARLVAEHRIKAQLR